MGSGVVGVVGSGSGVTSTVITSSVGDCGSGVGSGSVVVMGSGDSGSCAIAPFCMASIACQKVAIKSVPGSIRGLN